jgi:putative transcriptional regulator
MSDKSDIPESLGGLLLVAMPSLLDPHFRRTVLYLSHHSKKDGAVGLVINRPLHLTVQEIADLEQGSPLSRVPLFYGGPVGADQPVLAGLRWREDGTVDLRNFAGSEVAEDIPGDWHPALRLFIGHSGWSPGQLEKEIEQKAWLVLRPIREVIEHPEPEQTWRFILRHMDPMLKLLAEAPENPGLN